MSEQERRIAENIAQVVMSRILDAVQNDEVAEKVIEVWGGKIDRTIGRGLRRLGFYVVIGLIAIGAMKLGLLDKIAVLLKP